MFDDYEDILTVSQIMEILYIGKNTAYRLLNSGQIKSFKIGKVHKVPRRALERYILDKCNK
ncbi:helix-turn-helix domain-containing protein [Propionispora vibrioides]|uniref:DNA binding domain-containing protein, excisionase family n=1 Tax=Propionispora vibrioides TaxID=112903 RepID=A0A1H8Y3U6_9FIRM|nr:helix-turn-helix domain-containing protein [Propionispora vibrioides]SEP46960.1 DNA binding domain-containing protein, excisionase family [Propionispora vibrioides]